MKKIALMALALAMTSASFAEDVVISEQAAPVENAFDTFYFGLGIGGSFVKYDGANDAMKQVNVKLNEKCNRFIGSAVIGAGKTFKQRFYAGAEILMDFTKAKTKTVEKQIAGANVKVEGKFQGITPQFAVRLGYVNPCWNTLFYGKMGVAYNKGYGTVAGIDQKFDEKKAGFVLGLGVEKMFCKKFSARLEGDYNFGNKKNGVKFNKGFTVRALVAYNIKY